MRIAESVYRRMISSPPCPPETGGILGGNHGVITHIVTDRGLGDYDRYVPDTSYLNRAIAQWAEHGISFMGIYHTHFNNDIGLSHGDKRYISEIMDGTGDGSVLYFPIVLPGKSIIAYRAEKNGRLLVVCEDVDII